MTQKRFVSRFDSVLSAYAWCAMRRHLRHFLDHGAAFTAAFVVEGAFLAQIFENAARMILTERGLPEAQMVHRVPYGKLSFSELMSFSRRNSIFIFENADDVPDSFEHSATIFAKIQERDAQRMRATIYRHFQILTTNEEAEFLASVTPFELAFAFREGNSFSRGISGLRRKYTPFPEQSRAARKALSEAFSRVKELPKKRRSNPDLLRGLSGYGEAVNWGIQLCRDLDDYRDKLIGWDAVERGLLLYGPPGTGKTQFARKLAEACNVPIFIGSYAEWQKTGHQGDMLKAMSKLFEDARKQAPSIVVIDELDGFVDRASRRNGENDTYMRGVVNGLLENLDGGKGREGVVVVGMTNEIQSIDPALLRSNRIDTHIEITLPDDNARCAIIEAYLGSEIPQFMRDEIAERSSGNTGSDLEVLARRARAIARAQDVVATAEHVMKVLPPLVPAPPEFRWATAVHEAGHIVIGISLQREIIRAEVARRYSPLRDMGHVRFEPRNHRRTTRSTLDQDIMVLLAGIAAEQYFLGEHDLASSGSEDSDLVKATTLATRIELAHGMGRTLSSEVLKPGFDLDRLRQLNPGVAMRVDAVLQDAMLRTRAIIAENTLLLETLASELMERAVMSGGEILDFLSGEALVVRVPEQPPPDTTRSLP